MPKDLNERDTKLVQWLNEAHAKEAELEADLTAHIALTDKAPYKKRLQQHLKETREHKRAVARRIKQLGGVATTGPTALPNVLGEAAGKTVAAVKGQVGAARAAVTTQAETHLRNAQEELREEHVEIALYLRIETFAGEVGDRETAQLAKRIGRDEQRMAKYLTAELPRLVKEIVKSEVPRDQRSSSSTRRRTTTRSQTTSARSRTSAGSGRKRAASGSASSRSTRSASRSSGTTRSSNGSRATSGTTRSSNGSRATSGTTRSSNGSRSGSRSKTTA